MKHFIDIILRIFGVIALVCAVIVFIPTAILFIICLCGWFIADYIFGIAGELLNRNYC